MDNPLVQFVDKLIEQRNFPDLTPEVHAELRRDVLSRLDSFLVGRTVDALSGEDADQFVKMLEEKKSIEELQQFAKEHIAEYDTVMTEALTEFRDNYLEQ